MSDEAPSLFPAAPETAAPAGYQVLARKWRPKSFASLVGQEHAVKALTHALEQQRLHHAYLFTGTRGVGKTTIARIMAKALNCDTGVTPAPCGVCGACREIDAGRFVDYIEMDAASNRGVDDMAQLLERATYAPTRGRYKVYVIDEVHQLSGHAFNAMLKTLEEPPEHVKFILATTDPQKIPVTVLSRCLQFNLKQMPQSHIVEHLSRVLTAEGVGFDEAALRPLAKAAAGSMRDALSLLDQAIAHGAGEVREEDVLTMLGAVGGEHLLSLLDGLVAGDINAMVEVAKQMETRSLSFDTALQDMATLFHRIALAQFAPQALLDAAERATLDSYAGVFDAEYIQLGYQICIHGRDELALAPDEYAGFVMTLLRLHAFAPARAGASAAPPATTPGAPARSIRQASPTPPSSSIAVSPAPTFASPGPSSATPALSTSGEVDWDALVGAMPNGRARQLAQQCAYVGRDGAMLQLCLPPTQKFLLGKPQEDKLQADLAQLLGEPVRLNITLGEPSGLSPAERARTMQRERQADAEAAIAQDPFVRESQQLFGASVDPASIKPI